MGTTTAREFDVGTMDVASELNSNESSQPSVQPLHVSSQEGEILNKMRIRHSFPGQERLRTRYAGPSQTDEELTASMNDIDEHSYQNHV